MVSIVLEQLLSRVPGGTGRYTRELAAALASTAPEDARVRGWTAWHRDVATAQIAGVAGPRRLPLGARALAEAWRRGVGPVPTGDLLHAPTLLAPPAARGWARGGRGLLVVTIHDAVPWTHPETLTPRGARWHRDMGDRVARDADAVLVPTHAVAEELARHLPLRRVEVVGEGVSSSVRTVPADADERAARLQLPPDGYALVVGTLEPRKGLDVALAATRLAQWRALPLLVAGPRGWGDVELRADGSVQLLGRVTDPDLAVAYSRASVVLVPSRAEGFGLPALEAMAHGVPVVVSEAPALVEVAGGAALVVPCGDAEALASGVAAALTRHAELSAAGLERVTSFTWDAAARACWELYARLWMHGR